MVGQLRIESDDLRRLARVMRTEADGKQMRKDLQRNIRQALNPARNEARAAIKSMPSRGSAGPSLRSAVARGVSIEARLSGRSAGARLKARKTKLRGFTDAPKRLNRSAEWRHPVYGNREVWVSQTGKPGWFDDTTAKNVPTYARSMLDALNSTANRIAGKV